MTVSTEANVGETAEAFTPMSVDEARALMTEGMTDLDRATLLAERAEAEAQLRAAEATLGISPTAPNGAAEQEPDEAAQKTQDVDTSNAATLDVEELRRAATVARAADDALARAASEAAGRPPADATQLGTAESAFARALELQEDLPAAWRRLVGALISATGMAIVIGALGWNVYWLLVPIALIAILTVDLRLAGRATREASAEAAGELATVGVEGTEGLDRIRVQRTQLEEAEGRLASARADRDAAYTRFEELAPGRLPSEVEEVIAEYEAERAAQAEAARAEAEAAAQAEAEAAAQAEAEAAAQAEAQAARAEAEAAAQAEARAEAEAAAQAETAPAAQPEAEAAAPVEPEATTQPGVEADAATPPEVAAQAAADFEAAAAARAEAQMAPEPAVTVPEPAAEAPATATEWWFGSKEAPAPPPAASAPVRALAERLSAEGREALARIEAQLAALDRVELAKRSLEWHEANGSAEPGTEAPPPDEIRGA